MRTFEFWTIYTKRDKWRSPSFFLKVSLGFLKDISGCDKSLPAETKSEHCREISADSCVEG